MARLSGARMAPPAAAAARPPPARSSRPRTVAREGAGARALALACLCAMLLPSAAASEYKVGMGIADITGPPNEITFMGYGQMKQRGTGLHLRQFARTFVVEDAAGGRLAFVNVDYGMVGHGVRQFVIASLQRRFGKRYSELNVMLSGTHTHSGPGGFLMDVLFDLPSLGFVRETFEALVAGIVLSISRAEQNLRPGRLSVATGVLKGISVNRSPTAYAANPAEERSKYDANVDHLMTQLRVKSTDGTTLGCITWYAVHATSMNNTNTLVSSDNLGYAELLLEERMNPPGTLPGKGAFVGAFASSNEGDVSPNTREPFCLATGQRCDARTSSCPTKRDMCVAAGPGRDMFESTWTIAKRLADKAWELLGQPGEALEGPIRSVHQFVDMPKERVTVKDPRTGRTVEGHGCPPAMGYSFAAGTTDGPGASFFQQGTTGDNPLWNAVRDLLAEPTQRDIDCHYPKPILINTGSNTTLNTSEPIEVNGQEMTFPLEWQPSIVPTQIAQIGQLFLVCVPGEFTTMSGRRLRAAVKEALLQAGAPDNAQVVIAGLCNAYTDYVTTPEEYQVQRYEGASTVYGPYTLPIYLQRYRSLAAALVRGERVAPGPSPPDLAAQGALLTLQTPVVYDWAGWGNEFGDCLVQPPEKVLQGETVRAVFASGNPRNNMRHGASYMTVDCWNPEAGKWNICKTDAHWDTKFHWTRKSTVLGTSVVTLEWAVGNAPPGTYRFRHYGDAKEIFTGKILPYVGASASFSVVAAPPARYGSSRRIRAQV